jgi:replication factor C subunit 3/5
MCLLRELYGSGVERLRIERQEFETPSKKTIEMTSLSSNYHIEINPSDAGIYDRVVIQELIKNIAQTNQLDSHSQKNFKGVYYFLSVYNKKNNNNHKSLPNK